LACGLLIANWVNTHEGEATQLRFAHDLAVRLAERGVDDHARVRENRRSLPEWLLAALARSSDTTRDGVVTEASRVRHVKKALRRLLTER